MSTSEKLSVHPFLIDQTINRIWRDGISQSLLQSIKEVPENFARYTNGLNVKSHPLPEIMKLTYRKVENWIDNGLLFPKQEVEGEWKTYSKLDIIWIHCLNTLRDFGLPISTLKIVRQSLSVPDVLPGSEYSALQFYMHRFEARRDKCFLVVFSDGLTYPLSMQEFVSFSQELAFDHTSFVAIDLFEIFSKFYLSIADPESREPLLPEPVGGYMKKRFIAVSLEEMETIILLRDQSLKQMTVTKRSDKKRGIEEWDLERIFSKTDGQVHKMKEELGVVSVEPIKKKEHILGYRQRKKIKKPTKKQLAKLGLKSRPE